MVCALYLRVKFEKEDCKSSPKKTRCNKTSSTLLDKQQAENRE
jgi:hypothetical protein